VTNQFSLTASDLLEERERVKKLYSRTKHTGFPNAQAFSDWWMSKLTEQNGCCIYCETPIGLIRKLIEGQLLNKRKVGYGFRGPYLELERKEARGIYDANNCALSCYYCNNDKSYIYSEDEYKEFFAPAKRRHFSHLAQRLSSTP
jgi:hypothetical protein